MKPALDISSYQGTIQQVPYGKSGLDPKRPRLSVRLTKQHELAPVAKHYPALTWHRSGFVETALPLRPVDETLVWFAEPEKIPDLELSAGIEAVLEHLEDAMDRGEMDLDEALTIINDTL